MSAESGQIIIETLDATQVPNFVETLAVAFKAHPIMPPGITAGKSRHMFRSILKAYGSAPDATRFGIRREGRLVCAALVFDGDFEPRAWSLVVFLLQLVRIFGVLRSISFARVLSAIPHRQGRPLELMLLGTLPDVQAKGLGRTMLRHIYGFAAERGYDSIILSVAKETPAYGFYLREGFEVEKEITLPTTTLCFVRRTNNKTASGETGFDERLAHP